MGIESSSKLVQDESQGKRFVSNSPMLGIFVCNLDQCGREFRKKEYLKKHLQHHAN